MKTRSKSFLLAARLSFGRITAAVVVLLFAARAPAQSLFVSVFQYNVPFTPASTIMEITPGGAQSTFASGLGEPFGPVFNTAGNLFEADYYSGDIYEFTPGGIPSTF